MSDQISRLFRTLPGATDKLRIGVMLDGWELPASFAGVLEDVNGSNFAEVSLIILNEEEAPPAPSGGVSRYVRTLTDPARRRHALYSAYEALIQPRLPVAHDPLESLDVRPLLQGVPVLPVKPLRSRFVHRFPSEALERVRDARLDVILRFGFNVLRGEILEAARYGVWSFHHGDNEFYRGLPPGFWEMAEGNPVTGVILQRLSEELDAGLTLARANFMTHSVISVARNRYGPYWGGRHFVIQKLRELKRDGWAALQRRALPALSYRGRRVLYRRPTNLDVLSWGARRVLPHVIRKLRHRGLEQTWDIGLRRTPTPLFESGGLEAPFTYNRAPRGHFWADPCLAQENGTMYVFFEDFDFARDKGLIGVARVGEDGQMLEPRTVLECEHHLSYPCVFEHAGAWWMIPESAGIGVIELYRARQFPDRWERVQVMLEIAGLDTTVFQHGGRWWLITTPDIGEHHAAVTLLFSAPSLLGPWAQHPQSPISTDVRTARSAGPIIETKDRLLRVSQDCSDGYGRQLIFSEILELTPERYREERRRAVPPVRPGDTGMHSYGWCGQWEVIDAKRLARKREVY